MKLPATTEDAVRAFERLVPTSPGISVRKVFGQPAAFVGGNMFLGAFGPDVFVRLSESDLAEASQLPGFRPFEPMPGRAMRGYLVLPKDVARNPTTGGRWVERAVRFASSLPAKKPKSRTR